MTWRTIGQTAVAAVVGAGIFEAGRIVALFEMLGADRAAVVDSTPLERPRRIGEPVAHKAVAKANPPAEGSKSAEDKGEPRRKKYADPPLAARDSEFIAATELTVRNGDYQAARALGEKAAKSSRREVREAAVRMLAWFGRLGIAELTPFLADGDDGVAMDAAAEWKRIFANECNDRERLEVAALVMNRLTSEAMLEELGVEDMFNEVDDESAAVASLIGIIKAGNPAGVKVAKAAYDTVTGEAWKDEATARKWMKENASDAD